LQNMSDKKYRELAFDTLQGMKQEEIDLSPVSDVSLSEQRISSDRLANAPAAAYGKLLNNIANGSFSDNVTSTVQELLEWPMEKVEENKDYYKVVGSKGGSTAFVFNDTMYVERLDGQQIELVLFTDNLSTWQSFRMQLQVSNSLVQMINDADLLHDVEQHAKEQ